MAATEPEGLAICRKVGYVSRGEARHTLRHTSLPKSTLSVYRCTHCGFWHLGHRIPKTQRNGRG